MMPALYDLQSGDLQWLTEKAAGPTQPSPIAETRPAGETDEPPAKQSPSNSAAAPAPGAAKVKRKAGRTRKARNPMAQAPAHLRDGTNHLAMIIGAVGIASLIGGLWMALRRPD